MKKCESCARESDEMEMCFECEAYTCDNCIKLAEQQEVACLFCWKSTGEVDHEND